VGAELFHADGRTDMTKLTVAFRNFANASKSSYVSQYKNNRAAFMTENLFVYCVERTDLFVCCVERKDSLSTINLCKAVSGKINTKTVIALIVNTRIYLWYICYIFIYGNIHECF
jgi:hypothetical protein